MKSVYVIDNYDSFVYNIIHILEALDISEIKVVKNDEIDFDDLQKYRYILLSPGPGIPQDAGQMMEVIQKCHQTHSILGVCLGHQALAVFFDWELRQLKMPLHGVASTAEILYNKEGLFNNFSNTVTIGHYHSWVVLPKKNSENQLLTTSIDAHENVMAFQHKSLPLFGVQFHPESVLTEKGRDMIRNWLAYTG